MKKNQFEISMSSSENGKEAEKTCMPILDRNLCEGDYVELEASSHPGTVLKGRISKIDSTTVEIDDGQGGPYMRPETITKIHLVLRKVI